MRGPSSLPVSKGAKSAYLSARVRRRGSNRASIRAGAVDPNVANALIAGAIKDLLSGKRRVAAKRSVKRTVKRSTKRSTKRSAKRH